ncbi:unnamed protein product [Lactuca saligna]|uniref:Uncharacterized protein n=1 Tax=Lactuca saligna TaxID=75948 RepID=A0AA36E442_LACSI|nr:unnamed protein product [Lactuca saligna]
MQGTRVSEKLHADISTSNSKFQTSISSTLCKFQEDLAVERKIMNELARQTTQVKTQSVKLKHAQKEIDYIKSERTSIKSCVSDVNYLLSNLIEAHDPVLTITIPRHLADKLRPKIALLNRIKGVPEVIVLPEQGGDQTNQTGRNQRLIKARK